MDNINTLTLAARHYLESPTASFNDVARDLAEATGWDEEVAAEALDQKLNALNA